ncbi:ABC transporter permease [Streptomyces sp. NPDC058001]|uniref:ABC transporter permease n=1 Tax=Streptomyces sp. NPDC058001 TaxID=3346300 RepID=UPI0036E1A985
MTTINTPTPTGPTVTEPVTSAPPEVRRGPGRLTVDLLERAGVPVFLVLLIILFSLLPAISDLFRSEANIQNVFANQSVTGLIALAMIVPLVCGYFDLSVAAVAGLANVTMAAICGTYGQPIWLGLLAAVAIAGLAGVVNGVLVAGLRLNGFIVTLGTYTLIGGLLTLYTGGQTISNGIPASLGNWGSQQFLGIAQPFWLLLVVAIVVWYLLMQTPFGRRLEAIGSNESAARLVGIRVDRAIFLSFLLSGLLAGIAGVLLTSRSGGADPTGGSAYLFPALAAVFLGQTAIRPGRYNVWGTIFGVFLVAVAVDGFTLLGVQSWVQPVFNGVALVLSVAVSTYMGRVRERRAQSAVLRAAATSSLAGIHGDTSADVPADASETPAPATEPHASAGR